MRVRSQQLRDNVDGYPAYIEFFNRKLGAHGDCNSTVDTGVQCRTSVPVLGCHYY